MTMSKSEAGKLGYQKTKLIHEINRKLKIDNYNKCPILCKFCQKPLSFSKRKGKYCNHSCSAKGTNSKNIKHGHEVIAPHPCSNCKTIINSRIGKKYCSHKCRTEYNWKERVIKIEDSNEVIWHNSKTAKKFLTTKYGHKCQICGLSEWLGQKLPLILDHINGNSDDWSLDNLRQICSNCDSLTPTYKFKNAGNGRHYRKLRYREGKSY
jgi:hypothetical protein